MPPVFQPFGAMHGLALTAGALAVFALIRLGLSGGAKERFARAVLAFFNLAAYGYSQAAWSSIDGGHDLDSALPFHLCDIAAILAGFALLTGNRRLSLLTYFWGLAATVQALATPAITIRFPHPAFISFFVHHFAVVGAALYLPIVGGWRPATPWWKSPLEAWLWALLYAALAFCANLALGTNFGFLAGKPVNPSLLDHLGPWPAYLFWMGLAAFLFFSVLMLPFLPCRRRRDAGAA